jgi:cell division protein FtsI (penicillin-binding protein 3)
MKGLYTQKEFQRFYPDSQIAAQVLGYVGLDDNGLGGIEGKFDGKLHGVPGRMFTAMDARRRVIGSAAKEPDPGQNLQLTIDENIQFMAERALDHNMERTHADSGTVVVQDVHTGQILALAIRPTFNPNQFRHTTPALLKNHAISDVYEPGSTFKLVTYSAALDQGVTHPDDMIDCQNGQIKMAGGRIIHDDKADHFGVVTVHYALEHSSDVAAVKLALKIGPDNFYKYIHDFGFGGRTGVELPGETRGLLRKPNRWGSSSIGSIAIGQEVGVTPVQLVSMVSTIANGGVYLPPHVLIAQPAAGSAQASPQLQAQPFRAGGELPDPLPTSGHRVLSELTAAEMRKMMEGVVLYGTGKPAQLNGYSSGGKTGTAQKVDPVTHLYSKSMHVASFAGIAPVNNPVIAVAVIMDNPKGASYYGTAVSAPVFAEVAQQVLEYLNVQHDVEVRATKSPLKEAKAEKPVHEDDSDADQAEVNALFAAANDLPADDPLRQTQQAVAQPAQQATAQASSTTIPAGKSETVTTASDIASNQPDAAPSPPPEKTSNYITVSDGKKFSVPTLVGLPIRTVIEMTAAAGLQVQISGSGTVREQAPAPGTQVPTGTKIIVRCGR